MTTVVRTLDELCARVLGLWRDTCGVGAEDEDE
jgi:hypothetical protein